MPREGGGKAGGGRFPPPSSQKTAGTTMNHQGLRVSEDGHVLACDRYNRMGCDTKACTFSHVCNKCNDPTHRAIDCPNVRMYKS